MSTDTGDNVTHSAVGRLLTSHPVEALAVDTRIAHSLRSAGVSSVGKLCALSRRDLLLIPHIGPYSMQSITDALKRHGLSLRER